jgi:hypothetical protein
MAGHPITAVKSGDFGGFKGTLTTFIKDVVYDLLPEEYYEHPIT